MIGAGMGDRSVTGHLGPHPAAPARGQMSRGPMFTGVDAADSVGAASAPVPKDEEVVMPDDEREWYLTGGLVDLNKLYLVARYLEDHESAEIEDIIRLIEKPWTYAQEYKEAVEWEKAGN